MTLQITPLNDAKLLLDINNAAVPSVNELTLAKTEWKIAHQVTPGLALLDDRPAGVVAVFDDKSGYDSDYFRWFTARYENFLYIDRVVVADWARGRGIARSMYEMISLIASARKTAIVADVYSDPPNVPSLALHRALGFEEVGSQYFPGMRKLCAKLMKYPENAKRIRA